MEDVRQVVLKLRNSGNVAVKREDYDEPVGFTFEGSYVIGSDILNTEPEDLINSINKKTFVTLDELAGLNGEPEAKLEKFLLNPKQAITLTFLLEGAYRKFEVSGRIVDGEIVKESNRQASSQYNNYLINILLGIFLLSLILLSFILFMPSQFSPFMPMFFVAFFLMLIIVLILIRRFK